MHTMHSTRMHYHSGFCNHCIVKTTWAALIIAPETISLMLSVFRTFVESSPLTPFAAPVLWDLRSIHGSIGVLVCVLCSDGPSSPSGGRAGSHFIGHHESSCAMMEWRSHRKY